MRKKVLLLTVLPATALAGLFLLWRPSSEAAAKGPERASARVVAVGVSAVQRGELPITLSGLGTVVPSQSVTVRSRVSGQLLRVNFREGQFVERGQLLAQVDPRLFRARLTQAAGQLAKDRAVLANAKANLERLQSIGKGGLISDQDVANQISLVSQHQAVEQISQGVHDAAALELSHTQITAPIRGRIGFRQLDVGNNVDPALPLAVIHGVQPIDVVFTLSEDVVSTVAQELAKAASEKRSLEVQAWDKGSQHLLTRGRLTTLDNQIDPATGTVKLKAEFDNRDGALFPNQFVNIRFVIQVMHDAITVPVAAVQRGREGPFAYVVGPQHVATVRQLSVGPTEGGRSVLLAGLAPGELVVVRGIDQVREGVRVNPVSSGPARP